MKINSVAPVSFKMKLDKNLQEKIKKEEFRNSDKRLQNYNKLFEAAYPGTEDTTVLNAVKNSRGDYELYMSTELAPGQNYLVEILEKPKNLAKSLLLLCNKTVENAEKRLFLKVIREKVRNYENVRDIRDIADNFEKNKIAKRDEFEQMLDDEIGIQTQLTNMGGGLSY